MKNDKIWLSSPHMGGEEMKYAQEAYDTNWVAPLGPNVDAFEEDIANFLNVCHVSALSSGTGALHLALVLLNVKPGDEVIVQSFTFAASVNPISYLGAKPILIDSERKTWNMCPDALVKAIEDRLSKGKKPKAIIPVHLYGMPAQMDRIAEIADHYAIPVIEDAAEALGSKLKGIKLGTWGKLGFLSFNGNKIITTSGGGALVSKDKQLIDKSRFLATQARDQAPHYEHSQIGYNYRLSNILAGIGRGQMKVLQERVRQRRQINKWYRSILNIQPGLTFQSEPSDDYYSNYWLTAMTLDPNQTGGIGREALRLALEEKNIEARPLWKPMHLQPIFNNCPFYSTGVSEQLFNQGLCLPSGSNMNQEDLGCIEGVLNRVLSLSLVDGKI
ncbi:DegT/DnrJ/EryC1/StrS family aminotransferase [Carboxylicivirga marina]|uniref:DegT/DnrJ/EryC1/StrS family aminotransferase n=1 Tax=Carboxylicivirga marina TaxID=2800988 RepID=UPI0025914C27|nr:aminotransferase class I/II-fold pyridoxal phosphate-dependent enzyme [uncultured Carboxylicivirga sp.]